jgi:hypothetical protein
VNTVQEVFRAAFAGEISVEDADARVRAIQAANGSSVSAHQVAEGVSDAAVPPDGSTPSATPITWNPHLVAGDPSVEDFNRLSTAQLLEAQIASPGLSERMAAAARWADESNAVVVREQADRQRAEHERRFRDEPAYAACVLQDEAKNQLRDRWHWITPADRAALAASAGMSVADFQAYTAEQSMAGVPVETKLGLG